MVIKGSLRQLMRTPIKTLFFFVLLILTVTFLMLGFNLWNIVDDNMQKIDSMFITIGTVEQKATSIEISGTWDAEKKENIYYRYPIRGDAIPMSVLNFPGADYIRKPEMRPFYCAYDPNYIVVTDISMEGAIEEDFIIVEMQPLADCETGDPVPVRIKKVLMGIPTLEGVRVMFCNHYEEKTYKLYADKTYIVGLSMRRGHEGSDYGSEIYTLGYFISRDRKRSRPSLGGSH